MRRNLSLLTRPRTRSTSASIGRSSLSMGPLVTTPVTQPGSLSVRVALSLLALYLLPDRPLAAQQQQLNRPAAQQTYTRPAASQSAQSPNAQTQRPAAQQAIPQQAAQQQVAPQQAAQQPGQNRQATAMQLTPQQAAEVAAAQAVALEEGAVNPVSPFPPLDPQWQTYLDQVLDKWELESGKVNRYECKFLRYQYDPTLAANDAYTIGAGVLKYMKPDKGMFKVEQLVYFDGLDKDNKPKYKPNPQKQFGEYWVCDGQYIDIRDENEKKCTKYQLPPQMQGNAIHMSPLPFVFGVKSADLKARYWIRPLNAPEGRKNEVWLEVYPRRADDAANYQRLQVVIDLQDWMPKGLIVFLPNWRAEAPHRELYEFKDREINAARLLNALFQQEFIPKDPPKDWKVIIEPYQDPNAQPKDGQPKVAAPPGAMPLMR